MAVSPHWRRRLEREIPGIILSLVIAISLWLFNQLRLMEDRNFEIEPELYVSDLMIPLEKPGLVKVTIRGDREQLLDVDIKKFRVVLDMRGITEEGKHLVNVNVIREGKEGYSEGLEVSYNPSSFSISVEKRVTKMVPVEVVTTGDVQAGFEIESGVTTPDSVMVTGARSEMEKIQSIKTERVSLEKMTAGIQSGQRSVTIDKNITLLPTQDKATSLIYKTDINILYSILVREKIKQITVGDLYINQIGTVGNLSYSLNQDYADLRLSGPELALNRLDINALVLGVELDSISTPGEYTVPIIRMFDSKVQEQLKDITDLGLVPSEVKVTVKAK